MPVTPAEILSSAADFEEFRSRILDLDGVFPFGADEMMELGRVYFLRYPDSSVERDMENIRAGYRIVRVCVLEKIMDGLEPEHRPLVRDLLSEGAFLERNMAAMEKKTGLDGIRLCRSVIGDNLNRIGAVIEGLPRGMIKERFVGGISKFYNMLYLLDAALDAKREG